MSDTTPRLGLPWLMPAQAQKHVTVNESLGRLDALIQCAATSRVTAVQPTDPGEGDAWILPAGATGADWDGFAEHDIAYFQDGAWFRVAARAGLTAYVADEGALVMYDGGAWTALSDAIVTLGNLESLGVGTAPDAANPFAAKLNQALWTARPSAEGGTGDLRYKLNKEGEPDTLSLLFQSGWSGRAEIGLAGSDDLTVKVSDDGASWREALSIRRSDGHVRLDRAGVARLDSLNGDALAGLRNAVINGGFSIWRRGSVFAGVTSEAYTADRWHFSTNSDDVADITCESFTPGQDEVDGDPAAFLRLSFTAGASGTRNNLLQTIENVRTFAGQTVTLSFWARASFAVIMTPMFQQSFGAGGSSTIATSLDWEGLSTDWARIVRTVTLPDISGQTLGDGHGLRVNLRLPAQLSGEIDIACVQVEAGGVATPFERRPAALELALCRRYFERLSVRTENGARHIPLAPKRIAPSVTVSTGSAGHVTPNGFELTYTAPDDCDIEADAEF